MATRMLKAAVDRSIHIRHVGTAAADDTNDYSNITSGTATQPFSINGCGSVVVHVFGDTNVTGSPTVECAPTPTGPWAVAGTATNPTTGGALVPVPFGAVASLFVRANTAGTYTGGSVRATLMADFPNGNSMW